MHADGAGGLHIVALADAQHLRPHQPCRIRPCAERNGQNDCRHGGADGADEGKRQQEVRHDLEGIGDAHQRFIHEAVGKTGNRADNGAENKCCGGRTHADEQRCLRAMGKFGQHIAAQPVGAERQGDIRKGRNQRLADDRQRVAGKQEGCGERNYRQQCEDDGARHTFEAAQEPENEIHAALSPLPMRGSRTE